VTFAETPSPAEKLASRGWRLRNSLWLGFPLLSIGFLTWVGFLYVGFRAQRLSWWLSGFGYLGAMVTLLVISDAPDTSWWATLFTVMFFGIWFGGSLHALIINRRWLIDRAQMTPWYLSSAQPTGTWPTGMPPFPAPYPPAPPTGMPPFPAPYPPAPPTGTWPTGTPPFPAPYPTPISPSPPVSSNGWASPDFHDAGHRVLPASVDSGLFYGPPVTTEPDADQIPENVDTVDVNTAPVEVLARVPGIGEERARQILEARLHRGGFTSLDNLAVAVELAPHEIAKARGHVTFSHFRPPPGSGPQVRILDV
jgi:hypothetical protein